MKKLLLALVMCVMAQTAVAMQLNNRVIINSVDQFNTILKTKPNVVLLVSTTWCGPCKKVKPVIEELTGELPQVTFVHIDGDNKALGSLVSKYASEGFPTIKLFKSGKEVAEVAGAEKKEALIGLINRKLSGAQGIQAAPSSQPFVVPTIANRPPSSAASVQTNNKLKPYYSDESSESRSSSESGSSSEGESEEGSYSNSYSGDESSEGGSSDWASRVKRR